MTRQLSEGDALDPVDAARAREYALLAALLSCAASNALLERDRSAATATQRRSGRAHAALAEAAAEVTTANRSSANISTCSSVWGAANSCPMGPTI